MQNKTDRVNASSPKRPKNNPSTAGRKKKTSRPRPVIRTAETKIPTSKKNNRGQLAVIAYLIITAAVAGGIVYGWQKKSSLGIIESKEKEAQNIKYDLEEILDETKKKLTSAESENSELKSKNDELEAKADLLQAAKIEFESLEYGFSFFYPAVFGSVSIETADGAEGTKIIGRFSDNDSLVFGAVSADFAGSTSTPPSFIDTRGFRQRWETYYYSGKGGASHEVKPLEVVAMGTGEAIFLDKNSFVLEEGETVPVDIGENVGCLINLENDELDGIGFLNSDFSKLPLEDFISLIQSIKINKL